MKKNKKIGDYISTVDGKTTFAGIIIDFFEDMCTDNYWRAKSTQEHYIADYEQRILPFIADHDSQPLETYTYEKYRGIIDSIKSLEKYSEERVLHLMRLITAVARMAEKKYGLPNVLWGTAFELPETLNEKEKIQELVMLKKSLSPKQEIDLYRKLTANVKMNGERFGVYLMLLFGARNGEAAALTFGDILDSYVEEGFHVLLIFKTIESKQHQLVASGKTKNADRIIPVPEEAYRFLMKRKQYVAEQEGKSLQEVDNYPIACVGKDFKKTCTPDQIAHAAKVIFAEIGLKPRILTYLDYEILKGEDTVVIKEKDPTSYLMRRNFATQMVIIGMNEAEIQFLLGHDITNAYETRNEMISFWSLKRMGEKMNERALFYRRAAQIDLSNLEYSVDYSIRNLAVANIQVVLAPQDTLALCLESEEPEAKLNVRMNPDAGYQVQRTEYVKQPEYKEERTINILNQYHGVYKKYSG